MHLGLIFLENFSTVGFSHAHTTERRMKSTTEKRFHEANKHLVSKTLTLNTISTSTIILPQNFYMSLYNKNIEVPNYPYFWLHSLT